jgi:hypothetical protein
MRLRELFFENLDRTGESKSAVVGWGRGMGHKGHMFRASSVLTQANESGSDPYFVISRTMGKDDPLSPEEKLQIYNKVFPNNPQVFRTATEEMPDLNRVLKKLATMGYGDVTVVVGADQVNAFQYLVRPDKSGVEPYKQFGLENMKVIARQDTNDPSREEEGPRATPMRQALVDPNMNDQEKFDIWRDAMSPELSDQEVRDLMSTALQRMQDFSKPKPRATKKKDMATAEEAAGVGIVTKQNSTADVGPGTLRKNLKAFNLTK